MAASNREITGVGNVDWITIFIFASMVVLGWLNIYAAGYDPSQTEGLFSQSSNAGKQALFIGLSCVVIFVVLLLEFKVFDATAYIVYGGCILLLIAVIFLGKGVKGSHSWFDFGGFRFQPAELAKFGCSLALAKFLSEPSLKLMATRNLLIVGSLVGLPALIIILQDETGTALVFAAFAIMLYREGMPGVVLIFGLFLIGMFVVTLFLRKEYLFHFILSLELIGIFYAGIAYLDHFFTNSFPFRVLLFLLCIVAFFFPIDSIFIYVSGLTLLMFLSTSIVFFFVYSLKNKVKAGLIVLVFTILGSIMVYSVDYIIKNVLEDHQRRRIETLVNPDGDPKGAGYQVTQSIIAIASGQFFGKGFLQGTQTSGNFVPDQHTDFIFCTIGEEHGFVGSLVVIGLYVALLSRLLLMAERQKLRFSRVYIYSVTSIIFFHFVVNIGMTIGMAPVIGIPLPFFSYGGSSLLSFTLLLFTAIKLDSHRMQLLRRS